MICDEGDTDLTLRLDPLPNVTARVNGVVHTRARSTSRRHRALVTVDLRRGVDRLQYYFRCLPPDFPALDVDRVGETSARLVPDDVHTRQRPDRFVLGDPRRARRTGLVQAHRRRRARLQAPLQRSTRLHAAARRDVRDRHRSRVPHHRPRGQPDRRALTEDPENIPVDHHDYVELAGGGYCVAQHIRWSRTRT